MKYATIASPGSEARTTSRQIEDASGWWVQFGDAKLIYASDAKWSGLTNTLGRGALAAEGSIKKGNMHLVVQKGRAFQQAHPDIPVILDKGRYLVVDVPQKTAKTLVHKDEVCFEIEPLRENSVAFEQLPAATGTTRAGASDVVTALSDATFFAALSQFVGLPTRYSTSTGYQQAADWAEAQFSSLGYSARQDAVTVPGQGNSSNVVATKSGSGTNPGLVIVVAHLDSVNHPGGPNSNAPGADDNASGSAGVLTLAQAMAGAQYDHDLMFILFGGEEQGLHGSTQFVAAMSDVDKTRTKAVLNMDMIGHINTASPTVLLEGAPLSQSMIDGLAASAGQFTTLSVQSSLNPFASDHVPFIDAGVPAVLTIEGADSANDAIHTANDTLDRVDPTFAMEILRMNAGFLAEVAEIQGATQPDSDPAEDCGCGCNDGSETLSALTQHYQQLIAQYERIGTQQQLGPEDLNRLQTLRIAHAQLMTQKQS